MSTITEQQFVQVLRMKRKHTPEAIAEATGVPLVSVHNIIRTSTKPPKTRPPMRRRRRCW
ncbi:MAG TPA: hypothetical protein VGN96_11250 [Roseococcus sp.]|jgi:hypothetical protein|nr:hypothetical protein [Roseococcus sp.]